MYYNELILKVSSRCNLNCDYCYVFNKSNKSYLTEPPLLSKSKIPILLSRIKEHIDKHNLNEFLIIFHGGEPLLQSKDFYIEFLQIIKDFNLQNKLKLGLQTNATLLSQEWIDLFNKLDIQIGISFDGSREATNHRVFRSNGFEAYDEIIKGALLIKSNNLPLCTLSVMNAEIPASATYEALKDLKVDFADFLYPDETQDAHIHKDLSQWIINLFDCWYEDMDKCKPNIRYFDTILKMMLGEEHRGNEVLGRNLNSTICIKTNGGIELIDSMNICDGIETDTGLNIETNTFDESFNNQILRHYFYAHCDEYLCEQCRNCIIKDICGGGRLPHRFSKNNKFDNPTVYCQCTKDIVTHVKNCLFEDLPEIMNNSHIIKLKDLL